MQTPGRWKVTGIIGIGLLSVSLAQLQWAGPASLPRPPVLDPPELPLHRTPSQAALREAAFWWVHAVQLADDECDAAQEALHSWDPAASFDWKSTRDQQLARDPAGYLRRAHEAARRAAAMARTPRESHRAELELNLVERTAGRVVGVNRKRTVGGSAQ